MLLSSLEKAELNGVAGDIFVSGGKTGELVRGVVGEDCLCEEWWSEEEDDEGEEEWRCWKRGHGRV